MANPNDDYAKRSVGQTITCRPRTNGKLRLFGLHSAIIGHDGAVNSSSSDIYLIGLFAQASRQ